MSGVEDLVRLLTKVDRQPIRREKPKRNVPLWKFEDKGEASEGMDAVMAWSPPFPARLDGRCQLSGEVQLCSLDPNLVSLFDMEEMVGSVLYDRVIKNRNNGAITGATWDPGGKFGGCLSFDGASGIVNCGKDSSLNDLTEVSYEVWIYPLTYATSHRGLFHKWVRYFRIVGGTGQLEGLVARATSHAWSISNEVITLSQWSHVAMTWKIDEVIKLYINGVEVTYYIQAAGGGTPTSDAGYNLCLGAHPAGGLWYKGLLDEGRLYNRRLTADEVSRHAQGNYFNQDAVWG